jgi:8-oxo-dGTP pyrophosphatase MutT (NUDIX family)
MGSSYIGDSSIGNHVLTIASSRALVACPAGRDAPRRPGPAEVRADAPQSGLARRALSSRHAHRRRTPAALSARERRRHAGQISLPGGATDEGETLSEAALREAAEEIGVDPAAVRILGELTPVHVVVSGFTLHPIIGVTDERPAFVAAPEEVDEILEVSLDDLRDASRIGRDIRIREGVAVEWPYFDLLGHQVWGATAMVLGEFICLI